VTEEQLREIEDRARKMVWLTSPGQDDVPTLIAEVRRLREYITILGMDPDAELARIRPVVRFKESP
jgi:hypothetical protein